MTRKLSRLADRLVAAVVPKTSAGACACNDCWCATGGRWCCANCDCSKVTCYGTCSG